MAWGAEKVLAVVPARGGSKGIPRKNLREVGGLSLIARAARVIRELPWIDRAIISTDDPDMAEEGRRHGLEVPFMRPAALAADTARGPDVLHHAWIECERHYDTRFDYALYLEPTSPLRLASDVEATFKQLLSGPYQSATTVSRSPGHFTPYKCLLVNEQGLIRFYLPEGRKVHARQLIPAFYYRNGVAYAVRREPFFATKEVIGDTTAAVLIDRPLVNIDDELELEFADWLLRHERLSSRAEEGRAVPEFEPIFIGGIFRSGTTLLRAMLGQHPNIAAGLETYWFDIDWDDLVGREEQRAASPARCLLFQGLAGAREDGCAECQCRRLSYEATRRLRSQAGKGQVG